MIRLGDMHLFVRTAILGSFSLAAREADLLPGQVSAAIARLEQSLQVRLFARTTRSLRLTEKGQKYLPYARQMLDILSQSTLCLQQDEQTLAGELTLSLPSDLGRHQLLPLLHQLTEQYPAISLQLLFTDELSDLYKQPIDIALRYGEPGLQSYVAKPLVRENRRVLVASPDYLRIAGTLEKLEELSQHQCLIFSRQGQPYADWLFGEEGQQRRIRVTSRLSCNDAEVTHRCALSGKGIAYKSRLDVKEDLRRGDLVELLPQIQGEHAPLYFICPHRSDFSPLVQEIFQLFYRYFQQ